MKTATPRAADARPDTVEPAGALAGGARGKQSGAFTRRDPLAAVMGLGDRAERIGGVVALALALGTHGAASARAMASLYPMQHAVEKMRGGIHDFFWATYDIELPKPPPKPDEPPPPPPPPPEPMPKEAAPAPHENTAPKPKDDPYDPPPPTPAQAAKILTAPDKPDEPLDLTDKGFVNGDGTGPGYGMVSQQGTGNAPTFNKAANIHGTPGGTGTGAPAAAAPSGPDLSKPPGNIGGAAWSCPFPPEADVDGVDQAVATIVVTVRPDGTPLSVKVVSDPGHGFGRAARMCALGRRFTPALDRGGQPTTGTTPPIRVRFTR